MDTEARIRARYAILQQTYVARLRQVAAAMQNEAALVEQMNCRPPNHWQSEIRGLTELLNSLDALDEFYVPQTTA